MTQAITSHEDVAAAARSLFELMGEHGPALDLRLSAEDIDRIKRGAIRELDDPTVMPRLETWTVEHIDDLYELRNRPLPPFDHTRGFWTNFAAGPRLEAVAARRRGGDHQHATTVFGHPVNFPFGVPACALTVNADWVAAFAKAGFDVITYKTVRDRPWDAHPFPQWGIVDDPTNSQLRSDSLDQPVLATVDPSSVTSSHVALANSFGVPSLDPVEWMADVSRARGMLTEGQILIVSVMGTPEAAADHDALAAQFARTAAMAVEAGAHAIEANLSCPNTGGDQPIFRSVAASRVVLAAIRSEVGPDVPVVAKIGYLPAPELGELFEHTHDLLQGITAINTVAVPVVGRDGNQYFPGEHRRKAGISGTPIHDLALEVIGNLSALRDNAGRTNDFVIIGTGGVIDLRTYLNLRDAGADVVQSCSGAWADPNLASRIQHEMTADSTRPIDDEWQREAPFDIQLSLLSVLPPAESLSVYDAAATTLLSPRQVVSAVESAERSGWVARDGEEVTITDKGRRLRREARRTPAIRVQAGVKTDDRTLDERFEAVYSRLKSSS